MAVNAAFPDEGGAGGKLPARTEQAPPLVGGARRAQQEALDLSARRPLREQTRRQHGGVVAEKHVAGAQETGQVGEDMMRHRAGAAVDDEQARLVAARGGGLRNEALGQRVIEKFGAEAHGGGGSGPGPGEVGDPRIPGRKMEPSVGFEPTTCCLRNSRSDQLS